MHRNLTCCHHATIDYDQHITEGERMTSNNQNQLHEDAVGMKSAIHDVQIALPPFSSIECMSSTQYLFGVKRLKV